MNVKLFNKVKQSKLFQDSFWSLFGNVVGKGLSLIGGIFVARMLGSEMFGEYGMIKNTVLSLSILSTLGLGFSSTKFVSEFKKDNNNLIIPFIRLSSKITFLVSFVVSVLIFIFSDIIASNVLNSPTLSYGLKIASFLIVLNGMVTNQIGVIAGLGNFKSLAKINVYSGILLFLSSILFTVLWSFEGALFSLLISQVINYILNRRLIKYSCKNFQDTKISSTLSKSIINFTLPIAFQEIVFSFTMWYSSYLIIEFGNYGSLGVYSAAIQWGSIILFIPSILRNVVLSHLSNNLSSNEHNRIIKRIIYLNIFITLGASIIVMFLSSYIELTYGESYKGISILVIISCFTAVFSSVSNVYAQAYISKGLTWPMFFIRLFRDLGILLVFYITVKKTIYDSSLIMVSSHLIINIAFLLLMILIYKFLNKNKSYDLDN